MTNVVRSLAATGHTLRGVCYTSPDYLGQSLSVLSSIPPERVGLDGEYDYYGLAKRIKAGIREQFGRGVGTQITVKQRGSAVILSGQIETVALLDQLITLALHTEGATHVEVYDVQVAVLDWPQPIRVA